MSSAGVADCGVPLIPGDGEEKAPCWLMTATGDMTLIAVCFTDAEPSSSYCSFCCR